LSDGLLLAWSLWLPGTALWALASYVALTRRLMQRDDSNTNEVLTLAGTLLAALVAGAAINAGLAWGLGPSWGTSLGVVVALYALFWGVIASAPED
jgi:hypothetical protein